MGGKRIRIIVTLKSVNHKTIKQGLYERDFWTYDFEADDGTRYRYGGRVYALFIGKRYEIVASNDGFRYGANQLKRIRPQLAPSPGADLFEG